MSTVTVLEQNGTLRAGEVIELAALAGLELAAAATLSTPVASTPRVDPSRRSPTGSIDSTGPSSGPRESGPPS
jgi:hypothetical protein